MGSAENTPSPWQKVLSKKKKKKVLRACCFVGGVPPCIPEQAPCLTLAEISCFINNKCPGGCVILGKRNKGGKSKKRDGRVTEEVGNT